MWYQALPETAVSLENLSSIEQLFVRLVFALPPPEADHLPVGKPHVFLDPCRTQSVVSVSDTCTADDSGATLGIIRVVACGDRGIRSEWPGRLVAESSAAKLKACSPCREIPVVQVYLIRNGGKKRGSCSDLIILKAFADRTRDWADIVETLEAIDLKDVKTYIQSGSVVFCNSEGDTTAWNPRMINPRT